MKRGLRITILILAFILFVNLFLIKNINAGVYISNPDAIYNIGDIVDLNITVDPVEEGPLKIKLTCGDISKDIFNGPLIENIRFPLTFAWIGDMKGNCYFLVDYSGDSKKTNPEFKISNELKVILDIDSFYAKPLEQITLTGQVIKLNDNPSNGEIEINIPFLALFNPSKNIQTNNNTNITNQTNEPIETSQGNKGIYYAKVNNGKFSISFSLPKETSAGDYKFNVLAYEKSNTGDKTNQGSATANIKIAQILTSIDVALNNQNIDPGEYVSFRPVLQDQSGSSIQDQVSIIISDKDSFRVFEKIVTSGDSVQYDIPTNMSSGYYFVKVFSGGINISKVFFVNEKAIARFELINETLFITNIGNIPYNKSIEIKINGKPFVRQLDLDLGKSIQFKLTGDGTLADIVVGDGVSPELKKTGISLPTGMAVAVNDTDNEKSISSSIFGKSLWIFSIIILVLFLAVLLFGYMRVRKRSVAYPTSEKKSFFLKKSEEKPVEVIKTRSPVTLPRRLYVPTEAVQSMVVGGNRNRAAFLALKIKNKVQKTTKDNIDIAMKSVYEHKGCIYEQGDFVIAVFSPLVTKTFNNEVASSKCAEKVVGFLKEHNRKFSDKIEFGIGINSGDIINEIRDEKLIFTPLGNSMMFAKRLAELSNEQVLITKEAYEKGISEIKAEKIKIQGYDLYEIKKVVDYEKNKKFIDDFLKRNEMDKYKSEKVSVSRQSTGYTSGLVNDSFRDMKKINGGYDQNKESTEQNRGFMIP